MPGLKQKKRQQILIIVLVATIIITGVSWYLSNQEKLTGTKVVSDQEGLTGFSITEERLAEIKLDFSIFNDPLFKSLKSHGLLPVTVDEVGRENPFEAY